MKCELVRVINANYVRYEKMNELISYAYGNTRQNITTMAIYIDLYSMLKGLYDSNVMIEDYTALTSCIVNMCAHYRDYFRKRSVNTVFFIINSKNHAFFNTQVVPGYNDQTFYMFESNDKVSDMIENNHELLELICKYLPGIYYLRRTTEASVIMYDIMSRFDPHNQYAHMIVSKDVYTWQLSAIKPNTTILRPKKKDNVDISYIITRDNLMMTYMSHRKCNMTYNDISPELLTMIIGGSSFRERNMKSLCNISKIIKGIHDLIENKQIVNSYNSDALFVYTKLANSGLKISPLIASNYFKAIDVVYQQLGFMNTIEADYSTELVNLHDKQAIQEINNKYFKQYPLDLNRL